MKNTFTKLSLLLLLPFATFVGCEDETGDETVDIPVEYQGLVGTGTFIEENTTWSEDQTLAGAYYVLPGVTLTVEPGVTVSFEYHNGNPSNVGMIVTLKGIEGTPSGRLVAEGTETSPIVFTSGREAKQAGDWGGIIMIGNAPNNIQGGVGEVEGLSQTIGYGGTDAADDSGVLKYARVEYVGFGIAEGSEVNGISFYSVGSGTTIDHVQVYKCTDDGFEFFGGTVNAKYLFSMYNDDDSFDFDEGYVGKGQFWLAVQAPGADNGFEYDGVKTLGTGNETNPTLFNVTLVGLGATGKDEGDRNLGMRIREDAKGLLRNFVITNFGGYNYRLDQTFGDEGDDATAGNWTSGTLSLSDVIVFNNALQESANFGGYRSASDSTGFVTGANVLFQDPGFTDASQFNLVPTSPVTGSTPPSDGFFDVSATHIGAFGSTNWLTGWVRLAD